MGPLSLDEARGMSMEDVVLVATVREHIRSKTVRFGVNQAEISRRVEALQAGTLSPAADDEVPPRSPSSEASEIRPCSPVNVTVCPSFEGRRSSSIKPTLNSSKARR